MDLNKSLSVHPRVRKVLAFLVVATVIAFGVIWTGNWLAEWHYNEFIAPFLA